MTTVTTAETLSIAQLKIVEEAHVPIDYEINFKRKKKGITVPSLIFYTSDIFHKICLGL